MKKALLLEDELSLSKTLEISLKDLGYDATPCSTIEEATKLSKTENFDLMLLDRQLPDGDSIHFCRALRARGLDTLILMLTASGKTDDKVEGLNAGADDYLPKPFSWEELSARITALGRRQQKQSESSQPATQAWQIDENKRRIHSGTKWLELTSIEFKLMARLLQSPGEVLSKKQLLSEVWGLKYVPNTRTVDWFIGRLRKHFESNPQSPEHILTIRGKGYLFEKSS